MKKKLLLGFIVFFTIACSINATLKGNYIIGPKVDHRGKVSNSGKSLFKWFDPNPWHWQALYFYTANNKLIEWEIEKMLKEHIFKMTFFRKSYVNPNYTISFLMKNPATAKRYSSLLKQYYKISNKNFNSARIEYLLIKTDKSWKDEIIRRRGKGSIDYLLKKYDKRVSIDKPVSLNELKKKAYNKYMADFKKSGNHPNIANWNRQDIIRDMLRQKAVTAKNFITFFELVKNTDNIPDDIAESIIQYGKSNNLSLLVLLGQNPKLTKAILKNFKYIKKPKYNNSMYYTVAEWALKPPKYINLSHSGADYFLLYASVIGDYNTAFNIWLKAGKKSSRWIVENRRQQWEKFLKNDALAKKFAKSKDPKIQEMLKKRELALKNPGSYKPSLEPDYDYTPGAMILLSKGSNLNMRNARHILKMNLKQSFLDRKSYLDKKFAKLLMENYFSSKKHTLASLFTFEDLPTQVQKKLFAYYTKLMKRRGYYSEKKAVAKKLLCIESHKYRRKAIRLLLVSYPQRSDEILQEVSLEWLLDLVKVASGKDSISGVKACQLIGTTSLLGKSAAPGLKKLLKTTKDFTIKIAAICALAEIGDRSSIPQIKKYYKNKNRLLARAAKQAVCILQPLDKEEVPLKEMLQTKKKR
jgi:hypothetical protein